MREARNSEHISGPACDEVNEIVKQQIVQSSSVLIAPVKVLILLIDKLV